MSIQFDDERMEEARRRVSEQTPEALQFALDVLHDGALSTAVFEWLNSKYGN
jgi:hypothetical protein